ncbi:MAG: DUF1963 domain-containing protein [Oscillospiraceae bacterium]|nr:DUF1963 domain-containing protein [Oscillospiraceae bacterium]
MNNTDMNELMKNLSDAEAELLKNMDEYQRNMLERADEMMKSMLGVDDLDDFMKMSKKEQNERAEKMNDMLFDMMGISKEEAMAAEKEMLMKSKEGRTNAVPDPELADNIKKYIKNAVYIKPEKSISEVEAGHSKIGGMPDMPSEFEWYRNESGEPLGFVMQINCEEIHSYDKDGIFPESGMLYFFYDLENQPWELCDDEQGAAVYYYNGDMDELAPLEFPSDISEECIVEQCGLSFESRPDVPCYEDYDDCDDWEVYYASAVSALGFDPDEYGDIRFKLGGYSDIIQNSINEEFGEEYIQLCQLDTYENGNSYIMYGDGGRLYYYIKASDLANRKFDEIQIRLQCF